MRFVFCSRLGLAVALAWAGLLGAQAQPTTDWRRANDEVAQFPRGHADVLKWERAQPSAPAEAADALPTLALPDPASAVRLAWQAHPELARVQARLGPEATQAVLAGRWLDLDPTLLRRVEGLDELLEQAAQAQLAWVQVVAAQALLPPAQEALEAAESAHGLGERMRALGHWNALQWAQVQAAASRARSNARRAQHDAVQAQLALLQRLQQDTRYQRLALPRDWAAGPVTAPLSPVEVQRHQTALHTQQPRAEQLGYPTRVAQADEAYRATHALATLWRDEVLPTRQRVLDETVLHYNGMLKSTWDLLTEVQARAQAQAEAIRARRDAERARIAWLWTLWGGRPPAPSGLDAGATDAPQAAGH